MNIILEQDNSKGYPEVYLADDMGEEDYDLLTTYMMEELDLELYDFEDHPDQRCCLLFVDGLEFKVNWDIQAGFSIESVLGVKANKQVKEATLTLAKYLFSELKGVLD